MPTLPARRFFSLALAGLSSLGLLSLIPACDTVTGGASTQAADDEDAPRTPVAGSVTKVYEAARQACEQMGMTFVDGQNLGVYAAFVAQQPGGSSVQVGVFQGGGGKSELMVTASKPGNPSLEQQVIDAVQARLGG